MGKLPFGFLLFLNPKIIAWCYALPRFQRFLDRGPGLSLMSTAADALCRFSALAALLPSAMRVLSVPFEDPFGGRCALFPAASVSEQLPGSRSTRSAFS
jgi:hypothetical protein